MTRGDDVRAAASVPYRLLEAVPALDGGDGDAANMLIQGDNLDALKALLPYYKGAVKCIYIDPPYNTKSAFEDYDDNLEHSQWLAMMYPRLSLLRDLLSPDGIFLISLNDDEAHYAKVICDEIFGRTNFISNLIWNYEENTDNQASIINYHEHILVYAKSGEISEVGIIDPNVGENSKLFRAEVRNTIVKNGPKNPISKIVLPSGFPTTFEYGGLGRRGSQWPRYDRDPRAQDHKLVAPVTAESGWSSKNILESFIRNGFHEVRDSKGQLTRFELTYTGAIEAVKVREQAKGHFLSVLRGFGTTNQMRLLLEEAGLRFTFPKPVGLISYLIRAFSRENDIILDSFAGSGTTGHAVLEANSIDGGRRRFVLIERSERTVAEVTAPRLQAVCAGELNVNATTSGGGYRFYRLGAEVFDADGHIADGIAFRTLAAHIWFSETGAPFTGAADAPMLGVHDGIAYALLYNGILGDRTVSGGNVLTAALLARLRADSGWDGPMTVYGEWSKLGAARLAEAGVTFKQTPYDVKAR